ncbi:heparinase II/III family protein [bacterium]|nr:heparinase II/III family protein [bacterium]
MKYALVFALILAAAVSQAAADITSQDIQSALPDKPEHPYLYFSAQDKPAILERIQSDPESGGIMKKLREEADRLLEKTIEPEVPVQPKNPNFTGSNPRAGYQRSYTDAALNLAFVYQMTGERKYAEKSFEYADAVCDIECWSTRYHQFPIIYTRVWPWNVPDDQVSFGCDLWTAETARDIATVFDWLYPVLDKAQRDRIRGALLEKAILTVKGNYEFLWWSSAFRCNWAGVCNSGIGIAALSILSDDRRVYDVVAESYNRIGKMLDQIDEDGGWQEGCSYWYYGTSTSAMFADALNRMSGGKYNLFKHPKLAKNTVNCPLFNLIPPNRTVNFEDSGDGPVGRTYYYNKLASETGSREAVWYRDTILGKGSGMFDIIWPKSTVEPGLPDHLSHHFRTIDWAVMRSDFTDPEKVVIAAKAGFHDDPHHGHLDCGTFLVYWRGAGYISEMKRAPYDEHYFQEERWSYPQATSVGHNVVFVNGELQEPMKHKDKQWSGPFGGRILEFRPGADRDYLCMDPSGAYPKKEMKGWRRHIVYDKPLITVVVDEVAADTNAEIEVRFHSEVEEKVMDGYVLLNGEKGDMALIPAASGKIEFRPGKHRIQAFMQNAEVRWDPYYGTVVKAGRNTTVVAHVILPVESEKEAKAIAKSLKLSSGKNDATVTFTAGGKRHRYDFGRTAEGLVLK